MRIYLVHWHQAEVEERARELRELGHDVRVQWSQEDFQKWGDYLPNAVVISLDRLPSHGREVAAWVWEAKKRQTIPIVFAGGAADKVKATREKFPKATFCEWSALAAVLEKIT
jgi:hypothetical protein